MNYQDTTHKDGKIWYDISINRGSRQNSEYLDRWIWLKILAKENGMMCETLARWSYLDIRLPWVRHEVEAVLQKLLSSPEAQWSRFFQGAPKFRSIHGFCPAPWSIIVSQWLIVMFDRTWYRHRPAELRPITMGNSPINWDLSLISLITMVVYPTRSQRRGQALRPLPTTYFVALLSAMTSFPIPKDAPFRARWRDGDCTSLWWFYWFLLVLHVLNRHELVDLAQCASSTPDFSPNNYITHMTI